MDLEKLFEDTKVNHKDKQILVKRIIHLLELQSKNKNKDFAKYILELLEEYPEIIPDRNELNFFHDDLERELDVNIKEISKSL